MKQAVLIFAKNLIPGKVKTRLAATIGNDAAMSVYRQLLKHTASITHDLPVEKIVYYSDSVEKMDVWDNDMYTKMTQSGSDLGERMQQAFSYAFRTGTNEVAIIGTDCFELTTAGLVNAFEWLKTNDVVIGPAFDGGYYLLAMKQMHTELFHNIRWSTEDVLPQSLAACSRLNLSVHLLPELSDIDSEKDLEKIKDRLLIERT